jgi:uracil-DNA glycosylase family protein
MTDPERPGAEEWVPESKSLARLREALPDCRGCELWRDATQAVFGEGDRGVPLMLVGEQPGDREDLAGEPFVGPAGRLLDRAIELAGLSRADIYVTNAVKHFRFELRGKRRLHQKPDVGHIDACRPWLEAEIRAVDPRVIVCLGATAGRAVLGRPVRIGAERGVPVEAAGRIVVITTHPSAILRLRDESERAAALEELAADLLLASRSASNSA